MCNLYACNLFLFMFFFRIYDVKSGNCMAKILTDGNYTIFKLVLY